VEDFQRHDALALAIERAEDAPLAPASDGVEDEESVVEHRGRRGVHGGAECRPLRRAD
jgi:hypothetical protein